MQLVGEGGRRRRTRSKVETVKKFVFSGLNNRARSGLWILGGACCWGENMAKKWPKRRIQAWIFIRGAASFPAWWFLAMLQNWWSSGLCVCVAGKHNQRCYHRPGGTRAYFYFLLCSGVCSTLDIGRDGAQSAVEKSGGCTMNLYRRIMAMAAWLIAHTHTGSPLLNVCDV